MPVAVRTQQDLELLIPWLSDCTRLGQDYIDPYVCFLKWLQGNKIAQPQLNWATWFNLVPRHLPDSLEKAGTLWMLPQNRFDLHWANVLSSTPHVHSTLLSSKTVVFLLPLVLGVREFAELSLPAQCFKFVEWLEKNPEEKFQAVVMETLGDLVPRWKAQDPQQHATLKQIFMAKPLLWVHSKWRVLDAEKVILLPPSHSAENAKSPLNRLSGHPVWTLFPPGAIEMWGSDDLGDFQFKFLADGLGLGFDFTEKHLVSILRTARQVFSASTPLQSSLDPAAERRSRSEFVWCVYSLFKGNFPTLDDRLFFHNDKWHFASELHWTPFIAQFLVDWKEKNKANKSLSAAIDLVYRESKASKTNFFDAASDFARTSTQLCEILETRFTKRSALQVILDLITTLVSVSHPQSGLLSAEETDSLYYSLLGLVEPLAAFRSDITVDDFRKNIKQQRWVRFQSHWYSIEDFVFVEEINWAPAEKWKEGGVEYAKDTLSHRTRYGSWNIRSCNPIITKFFSPLMKPRPLQEVCLELLSLMIRQNAADTDLELREEAQWCLLLLLKKATPDAKFEELRQAMKQKLPGLLLNGVVAAWDSLLCFKSSRIVKSVETFLKGPCPQSFKIFETAYGKVTGSCDILSQAEKFDEDSWAKVLTGDRDHVLLIREGTNWDILLRTLQEMKLQNPSPTLDTTIAGWVVLAQTVAFVKVKDAASPKLKEAVAKSGLLIHDGKWISCVDPSLKFLDRQYGSLCFRFRSSEEKDDDLFLRKDLDEIYASLSAPFNLKATETLIMDTLQEKKPTILVDKSTVEKLPDLFGEMYKLLLQDHEVHFSKFSAVSLEVHLRANQIFRGKGEGQVLS